jgi:hypothetical protein
MCGRHWDLAKTQADMSWPPCNICKARRRNHGNARHGAVGIAERWPIMLEMPAARGLEEILVQVLPHQEVGDRRFRQDAGRAAQEIPETGRRPVDDRWRAHSIGESKPSAPRQSGRQGGKKTQIAAVSAPERTIVEARAVPSVSEVAAAAMMSEKKAGMGNARSGNQQISFGMLDIATSSSSDGFEIAALGHGGHMLAQVVLTTAGKSAPVGDEIKASLVDTGAAGSVISEGFVARTSGLDIIEVSRASIFMGGKDTGFRVPVVQAVRAGVFLPTTRSLRKWTSLDVLKGNNWDLEGRDKALLFVVPDGVIPCGASVLLGLNVLAPQDDMGRPIGPMWDVHLS